MALTLPALPKVHFKDSSSLLPLHLHSFTHSSNSKVGNEVVYIENLVSNESMNQLEDVLARRVMAPCGALVRTPARPRPASTERRPDPVRQSVLVAGEKRARVFFIFLENWGGIIFGNMIAILLFLTVSAFVRGNEHQFAGERDFILNLQ